MALRPQLFSGARGQLRVNGVAIAYITDVSVNIVNNVRAIHTFGAANARSIEPLSTTASVTIGRVIPVNDGSGNPVNTSAINTGIEPVINQLLASEDISIDIIDKITQVTVASIKNCRFTGRSVSLSAQQVATERMTFVGIYDAANGNTLDAGPGL
jgi:hypothetical protein